MFRVSIMETFHNHTKDLSRNSLSDPDIWGRLIKYRKETQWDNILDQVEELESKFDLNPDGSKAWKRFVNEPVVDQYGQVWMIWKNGDYYQIYVIPPDAGKFKYVIVEDVSTTSYSEVGFESSQFSVGFDKNLEPIILNIVVDGQGGYIQRKIGLKPVAALVTVA